MSVPNPTVPTLHLLPKVYKDMYSPAGRPIVSGIGRLCEKVCTYIDYFLQPMVHKLPSFLQDSTATIRRFDCVHCPKDALLITCDVEALYNNISHEHGVPAVHTSLRNNKVRTVCINPLTSICWILC